MLSETAERLAPGILSIELHIGAKLTRYDYVYRRLYPPM